MFPPPPPPPYLPHCNLAQPAPPHPQQISTNVCCSSQPPQPQQISTHVCCSRQLPQEISTNVCCNSQPPTPSRSPQMYVATDSTPRRSPHMYVATAIAPTPADFHKCMLQPPGPPTNLHTTLAAAKVWIERVYLFLAQLACSLNGNSLSLFAKMASAENGPTINIHQHQLRFPKPNSTGAPTLLKRTELAFHRRTHPGLSSFLRVVLGICSRHFGVRQHTCGTKRPRSDARQKLRFYSRQNPF